MRTMQKMFCIYKYCVQRQCFAFLWLVSSYAVFCCAFFMLINLEINSLIFLTDRHDNERADKKKQLLNSCSCLCIRRTPLIFGLFMTLQAKSLATTIATYSEFNVKCMASSSCHQPGKKIRRKICLKGASCVDIKIHSTLQKCIY